MAGKYCATLGQITPCANMRRVPASRFTRLRVATIWSSDKSILCGSTDGGGGQQRHGGVAVEEHVLQVVVELVVFEVQLLADQVGVPGRAAEQVAARGGAQPELPLPAVVVVHVMGVHVEDELAAGGVAPLLGGVPGRRPPPARRRRPRRRPGSWPGTRPPCRSGSAGSGRGRCPGGGRGGRRRAAAATSTWAWRRVCAGGWHSPLDTTCVGTGHSTRFLKARSSPRSCAPRSHMDIRPLRPGRKPSRWDSTRR